jgi:hypothetical protein
LVLPLRGPLYGTAFCTHIGAIFGPGGALGGSLSFLTSQSSYECQDALYALRRAPDFVIPIILSKDGRTLHPDRTRTLRRISGLTQIRRGADTTETLFSQLSSVSPNLFFLKSPAAHLEGLSWCHARGIDNDTWHGRGRSNNHARSWRNSNLARRRRRRAEVRPKKTQAYWPRFDFIKSNRAFSFSPLHRLGTPSQPVFHSYLLEKLDAERCHLVFWTSWDEMALYCGQF